MPNDWDNIRVRRPSSPSVDPVATRFWIGLAVIVVGAIAYPWYAYWVNSYLLERDARAVAAELQQQSSVAIKRMNETMEAARMDAQRAQDEAFRNANAHRINAVRVMGASANSGNPVVIVALGLAGMNESAQTICTQSARWLGSSTSGKRLQVQAYRGNLPAITMGTIDCP